MAKVSTDRKQRQKTMLRKGDLVMVISGGNQTKRENKGKVGSIVRFVGREKLRVVVENVNMVKRHQRSTSPDKPSGIIEKEAPIAISNVMYYVEKLKKPVRLSSQILKDGKKVRGYKDPETKEFVQLDK